MRRSYINFTVLAGLALAASTVCPALGAPIQYRGTSADSAVDVFPRVEFPRSGTTGSHPSTGATSTEDPNDIFKQPAPRHAPRAAPAPGHAPGHAPGPAPGPGPPPAALGPPPAAPGPIGRPRRNPKGSNRVH